MSTEDARAQARQMMERSEKTKSDEFAKFVDQPLTKMVISMIPAGENPDTLRLLLKSAFDSGFNVGCAEVLGDILTRMAKK